MRSPLISILLAASFTAASPFATAFAASAKPAPPATAAAVTNEKGGDPEIAGMRRTLASVIVLKKLALTPEQKKELASIIADAKQLKARAKAELANDSLRGQRKQLLAKAIDEARVSGKVSPETKVAVEEMKEKLKDGASSLKSERREIGQRLKGLFTDAQREELKDMRAEAGRRAAKHPHAMLKLMMSDEFSAELAR
jgi:Spy/CpxP family protein refolding chaperone